MRQVSLKSVWGMSLGLAMATGVHAELLNISTNAVQSQNTPTAACTIVGKGGKTMADGRKVFVVLAEGKAADSNPTLVIRFSDGGVVSNDDWNSTSIDVNGKPFKPNVAGWLGRNAGRESDAGTVVVASAGEWFCVTSREVSGGDALRPVAVSVTDVTEKEASAKSNAVDADAGLRSGGWAGSPHQ
jgi:hypothetical protein